jgi:hypothetical protein
VLTHAKLCVMNPLGGGLLFIWIFSPLGGQSLLRILGSNLEPVVQPSTIVHFDSDAVSVLAWPKPPSGVEASAIDDKISYLANWYSALLLAPPTTKTDGMDLWGNIKIPFLSEGVDYHAWSRVSWSLDLECFSSLAGYPVANVPMGNSTFSMHTSYLQLNCSKQQRSTWTFRYNITMLDSWVSVEVAYQNGTIYGVCRENNDNVSSGTPVTTWNFGVDRFVDPFWLNTSILFDRLGWGGHFTSEFTRPFIFENETGIESKPANLFFDARIMPGGSLEKDYTVAAKCDVKQRYVESRVSCSPASRHNCTVVAQRPSRRRHAPDDISHLSFPAVSRWASVGLPLAAGRSSSGKADLSMKYLADSKSGHTVETIYRDAF